MTGRKILLLLFVTTLLSGCTLPSVLRPKYAALQITTKPEAEVFLDGKQVGETPFRSDKLNARDYRMRLVPKAGELEAWEREVSLVRNTTTVIDHEFAADRLSASGEILNLEKLADEEATELAAVTTPDNAALRVDGQPKGFTPIQIKDLAPGDHALTFSAPGHRLRQIDVRLTKGYRLTADVQLGREPVFVPQEATPSSQTPGETPPPTSSPTATPAAQQVERPYVEILETPTGWLRVRSSPTTATDNEITTVRPGERFPYLESNDAGWYKIRLPGGLDGWISGRYAKLYQ